jgi:hypothetical protein
MRGYNLFVNTGSLRPLERIKLKVPRFIFLNRFSSGLKKPKLKSITNQELRITSELFPVEGKDNF